MKRRSIFAAIIACAAAVSMTACGGDDNDNGGGNNLKPAAAYKFKKIIHKFTRNLYLKFKKRQLFFSTFSYDKAYRSSLQSEGITYSVFEIPLV